VSLFGKRIGVDLGTANVLVYVKGKGIVIAEPAVVAVAQRDNTIVAVGNEAREMLGRTPGSIQVIRPMRDGVIADYLTTEAMLRYFIGRVNGRLSVVKPEGMICVAAAGRRPSSPCTASSLASRSASPGTGWTTP